MNYKGESSLFVHFEWYINIECQAHNSLNIVLYFAGVVRNTPTSLNSDADNSQQQDLNNDVPIAETEDSTPVPDSQSMC